MDDKKADDKGGEPAAASSAAADEAPLAEVKGFRLDVLEKRRPELRQELLTFRDALMAGEDDEAIKVGAPGRRERARLKERCTAVTQLLWTWGVVLDAMRDAAAPHHCPLRAGSPAAPRCGTSRTRGCRPPAASRSRATPWRCCRRSRRWVLSRSGVGRGRGSPVAVAQAARGTRPGVLAAQRISSSGSRPAPPRPAPPGPAPPRACLPPPGLPLPRVQPHAPARRPQAARHGALQPAHGVARRQHPDAKRHAAGGPQL
jgi:hypothetical protein